MVSVTSSACQRWLGCVNTGLSESGCLFKYVMDLALNGVLKNVSLSRLAPLQSNSFVLHKSREIFVLPLGSVALKWKNVARLSFV